MTRIRFDPVPGFVGLTEVWPSKFSDNRGQFWETYNEKVFQENGITTRFVQDNLSFSKRRVLRGLHFQKAPHAQAKLIRVVNGRVLDVVVDLRPESASFKKHFSLELRADYGNMLFIPEGFAHGFLSLADDTIFTYKVSNFFNKEADGGVRWDDPDLAIEDWFRCSVDIQGQPPVISDKDRALPSLRELLERK